MKEFDCDEDLETCNYDHDYWLCCDAIRKSKSTWWYDTDHPCMFAKSNLYGSTKCQRKAYNNQFNAYLKPIEELPNMLALGIANHLVNTLQMR